VVYQTPGSELLFWHAVYVGLALGTLMVTYWLRSAHASHLVPRLWLLAFFAAWVLTLITQSNAADSAAAYYGALLETPIILGLAVIVAWRIQTVFAPVLPNRSIWAGVALVLIAPVFLLSHTTLNKSVDESAATTLFYPEVITWYALLLSGSIILLAVATIRIGRRKLPSESYLDIPNLHFAAPTKGHDVNLLDITHDVVAQTRRDALKIGKWTSFTRALFRKKGIVVTDAATTTKLLLALTHHALSKTPDNALSITLTANQAATEMHFVVSHTKIDTATWPHSNFAATAGVLGAAVTLKDTATESQYIVSWPLQF